MSEQNYIERYWRDATSQDAIREPPMVARFGNGKEWQHDAKLSGMRRDSKGTRIWYGFGDMWTHCQVYDAPDPGEGWRLVDVDSEKPMVGDEIKYGDGWLIRNHNKPYDKQLTYRRRIAPPKPKYEPFRWEDREQLRGRIVTYVQGDRTVEFRCETFAVDDGGFSVHYIYADWLYKNAVFVDTKEPVGRRVE